MFCSDNKPQVLPKLKLKTINDVQLDTKTLMLSPIRIFKQL